MTAAEVEQLDQTDTWDGTPLTELSATRKYQIAANLRARALVVALSYLATNPGSPDKVWMLTNPEAWLRSTRLIRALNGEEVAE